MRATTIASATGAANTQVYRRQSVIFRLTGYSPILPLVSAGEGDGAAQWRPGQRATRRTGKTVFRPNVAARTSAAALETADAIGEACSGVSSIDWLSAPAGTAVLAGIAIARRRWSRYCESIGPRRTALRARAGREGAGGGAARLFRAEHASASWTARSRHSLAAAALTRQLRRRIAASCSST